jgi:hypothetical protein
MRPKFWIDHLQKLKETDPRMVRVSSGTIQNIRKKFLSLIAWNLPANQFVEADPKLKYKILLSHFQAFLAKILGLHHYFTV